uniref:Uncharacterized protein n=1 Tax=Fagus sylvatica TaxID=28930 RepID=A0A2N9G9W4_FAGSY
MRWARDGDGATVRGARSRPSARSGGSAKDGAQGGSAREVASAAFCNDPEIHSRARRGMVGFAMGFVCVGILEGVIALAAASGGGGGTDFVSGCGDRGFALIPG